MDRHTMIAVKYLNNTPETTENVILLSFFPSETMGTVYFCYLRPVSSVVIVKIHKMFEADRIVALSPASSSFNL